MQMDGVGKRPGSSLAVGLGTWKCLERLGALSHRSLRFAVPQAIHRAIHRAIQQRQATAGLVLGWCYSGWLSAVTGLGLSEAPPERGRTKFPASHQAPQLVGYCWNIFGVLSGANKIK